jgi:hypothetical protein
MAVPANNAIEVRRPTKMDPPLSIRPLVNGIYGVFPFVLGSSGDALHLAIAGSLNAQGVICLDAAMIESAKSLGMKVVTV